MISLKSILNDLSDQTISKVVSNSIVAGRRGKKSAATISSTDTVIGMSTASTDSISSDSVSSDSVTTV